ncbi:PAS domain-containing sensor histidine kinase [Clostridium sp.]|uniref:sensor histidine kinase n=1 Tax=Clostridium sp. TaxID=1506 RepID=UPI002FC78098
MISITKVDVEFYDILSDPVIIIGEGNEILYCNERGIRFLRLSNMMDVKDLPLNNFIKFIGDEDIKFDYEFLKRRKTLNRINTRISTGFLEDVSVQVVGKEVVFQGMEGILLLFKLEELIHEQERLITNYFTNIATGACNSLETSINLSKTSTLNDGLNQLSEATLKTIITQTPSAVILLKDGKIVFVNKSGVELLGKKDPQEVLGEKLFNLVHFDFDGKESIISDAKKLLVSDTMLPIVERKLTRADGSQVYAELTAMCFKEKEDILTLFIGKNITKRATMEQSLQRSQADYSKLLKFIPFGIGIYSDSKVTFCNDALFETLGVQSINEINKKAIRSFIHKDSLEQVQEIYKLALDSMQQSEFKEVLLKRKNGTKVQVEVGAVPMFFDNKMSVVFVIHDITERKKAEKDKFKLEQALKYDKLKTEFISNVSHELKTPLNIILSIVQVLELKQQQEDENLSKVQRDKYIGVMKQNCYRLLRLINNLIDTTRIEVGYLKMDFGNYNIVKIIEDITLSTVEYIESKGMSIIFDTDVEEKIIGVDRENMERVMLNLLSNAVKFSKENGEIHVSISDLGDKVRISVKDNGIGIPKKMQGKVFERFVQGESLFTRAHEGSGIGLSLVKSIIEAHSGKVYVKSKENRGSEFIVDLPNIISKKEATALAKKSVNAGNVQKIELEFSDIYN